MAKLMSILNLLFYEWVVNGGTGRLDFWRTFSYIFSIRTYK